MQGMQGCKGCWNAQMLVMQGLGAIYAVFTVFFLKVGQRGIRSPPQGQGGRGCFGVQVFRRPACVQVMQAMLRRSLGCNKTRQRYTLRVGLPSLFELEDAQRSWIC